MSLAATFPIMLNAVVLPALSAIWLVSETAFEGSAVFVVLVAGIFGKMSAETLAATAVGMLAGLAAEVFAGLFSELFAERFAAVEMCSIDWLENFEESRAGSWLEMVWVDY